MDHLNKTVGLKQAKLLDMQVRNWVKSKNKVVVAIDGYTGVGKTTLLRNLSMLNREVIPVHRDDFLYSRKTVAKKFHSAKPIERPKIFELQVVNQKKLEQLVSAFKTSKKSISLKTFNHVTGKVDVLRKYALNKKVLVIEGVFMLHPDLQNHLWDKRVYLKGDINKIDKRRVAREKIKWGKDYIPETRPDSYFRNVTLALKRYIKIHKPEKQADLVINMD